MADNDIYDSKGALEKLQANLNSYLKAPTGMRTTQIKNPDNLRHFDRLFVKVAARDCSYIRRLRLGQTLLMVCHAIEKDLEEVDTWPKAVHLRRDTDTINLRVFGAGVRRVEHHMIFPFEPRLPILYQIEQGSGRAAERKLPVSLENGKYVIDYAVDSPRFDGLVLAFSFPEKLRPQAI